MPWKCFLIEPIDLARRSLCRYCYHYKTGCPGKPNSGMGHEASVFIESIPIIHKDGGQGWTWDDKAHGIPYTDIRWPTKCDTCDYVFSPDDQWQTFVERWYKNTDPGDETLYVLRELPVGAMYYADWYAEFEYGWTGPDGRILCVQTPKGLWIIDRRASNCTMPDDNEHRCWVRHGTPPNIHVDKDGVTCAAGAGSIITGRAPDTYHGFLHHGYLTDPC